MPSPDFIAPEFCERLDAHQLPTMLPIEFFRDQHVTLFSRVARRRR